MNDPYAHVPPPRPGGPDPDAPNPFAGIGAIGPKRSTPEEEKNTRTVVTVHKAGLTINDTVRYPACDEHDVRDGVLYVYTSGDPGSGVVDAAWAPGTWARVETTVEPVAPAEPEEAASPGTFEVYEDNAGKYRYRLKAANGEVIATGQEYSTRGTALLAARIVMDAAKGAPIVDVDGDDQ